MLSFLLIRHRIGIASPLAISPVVGRIHLEASHQTSAYCATIPQTRLKKLGARFDIGLEMWYNDSKLSSYQLRGE